MNLPPSSCSIQKKIEKRNWVTYMYVMWHWNANFLSVKLAVCSFYAFKRHLRSTDILIKRKWLSENNSFTYHFISFVLKFNSCADFADRYRLTQLWKLHSTVVYNKPFTNGQGCLAPLFKELQISLEIKADIWYINTKLSFWQTTYTPMLKHFRYVSKRS